ncbi:alkaline phospholipase D [Gordonia effusa NBRC 100432]|uniref:Alkaline phospholipase D n=1 Tax=Gordonia effusa NBRC 100432 TaxID=1077974 RepID=H0QW80_9ACTN|nr:alkaline phosphatase D family protein [Gordonia effusa]GAB17081.1 alkaline phospholipase D [Gordonia effusa NBRC 100432]
MSDFEESHFGGVVNRRTVLGAAGAGAIAAGLAGPILAGAAAAAPVGHKVFAHGVASGDPLPDAVIIWTRITPTPDATPGSGRGAAVSVAWELSTSESFGSIAASGVVTTGSESDHTVKVDVTGLSPKSFYWYRFRVTGPGPAAGSVSPVGRTKTAPRNNDAVAKVRFGVVSCANWEAGYFAAYRHLGDARNLDAVVHLGDYLYEYGVGEYTAKDGPVRDHRPRHDIVSVSDYRIRHAQYKSDPDLQRLHGRLPFICTWDDHESANDSWRGGAENHKPSQGPWSVRKANSEKVYYEWMPVRPAADAAGRHLYRRLRYGTLLELSMLDLRTYRDESPTKLSPKIDDPRSTITGRAQMNWLTNGISTSQTRWQIVGNPVMISPILLPPLDPDRTRILTELIGLPADGARFNSDAWDGYAADRKRLLDAIDHSGKRNTVFITGDIHMSWACEVPRKPADYPGAGSVATEFVVPSVTSNNLDDDVKVPENTLGIPAAAAIVATNRNTRWVETDSHGYGIFTVTPGAAQMDWYFVVDRTIRNTARFHAQSWQVRSGARRMTKVNTAVTE